MATKALESKDAYTIGWIAALDIEHAAAVAMLDEEHGKPLDFTKPPRDPNSYAWGRIGDHNIVIAVLPAGMYGQSSATATATHMISSFPQIRIGLMVGIGGGIPQPDDEVDIRLGDVVVSQPSRTNGGVAQYDSGKATAGSSFELRGFLSSPPLALLNAVAHLKSQHERQDPRIHEIIQDMLSKNGAMAKARPGRPSYSYQGKEHDRLFQAAYSHNGGKTCASCDASQEIRRDDREQVNPVIHYGLIASGNAVIKDAVARDEVLKRLGSDCLCVETEAAGLMNNFPCLVVRGICDYSDSHKNDRWQRYAAAAAAAYTKELLGVLDSGEIDTTKRAADLLQSMNQSVVQ
jgi:nucleoside phosphorylase